MAGYCNEAYRKATKENKLYEIRNDEFSYHVKQNSGVTILIFRGSANAKNFLSDIDLRPWKDDDLDVYLHRGFRDAADFVSTDIKKNYEWRL